MGWMDVEENLMGPQIIGETVNNCITTLAQLRHDLHKTEETWANVSVAYWLCYFAIAPLNNI